MVWQDVLIPIPYFRRKPIWMKSACASLLLSFLLLISSPFHGLGSGLFSRPVDTIPEPGWIDLDEAEDYTGRHECSFVQAGETFILFGGRENPRKLDIYDYPSNSWSSGAQAPQDFNHFQAITWQGYVWVIASFKNNAFPNEEPTDKVILYDPVRDTWITGPEIPESRRRGSSGLVIYKNKFYVLGGNTIGHNGGFIPWFDVYDPAVGRWDSLPDAPHARDHFHAALFQDQLYAIGGRLSRTGGGSLVREVDIYDFDTQTWRTLPDSLNIPTGRAAPGVAVFRDEILVMGGEGMGGTNSNLAYAITEAYDPIAQRWADKAPMNHPRHGFQAIVSGEGIYVAAGSPKIGGGNQKNMEVYNRDQPEGTPIVPSSLNLPDTVSIELPDSLFTIPLTCDEGNQGILIEKIRLSGPDSSAFSLSGWSENLSLLLASNTRNIEGVFSGDAAGQVAYLEISPFGQESPDTLVLLSVLPPPPPPPPFTTRLTSLQWFDPGDGTILASLLDRDSLNRDSFPDRVNILAELDDSAGSVSFALSGPMAQNRVDSLPPYTLFPDTGFQLSPGNYSLKVIPWSRPDGAGQMGIKDSIQFFVVEDSITTDLKPLPGGPEDKQVRLWPNPVRNYLKLRLEPPDLQEAWLEIRDMQGQVWVRERKTLEEQETRVDVLRLPAGHYLLRWVSENGAYTLRFIKR